MVRRYTEHSPLYYSRVAGILLLLMAVLAIFSNLMIIEGLVVKDDPAATAQNIINNEMLFRIGFICFIVVLILDVLVSWALYVVFKPLNNNLSILAAWFRLVYTAIFGIALYNLLKVLQLLSGAEYLNVFTPEQLHAQMMLMIEAFNSGWLIGLVFFAFHLFVIGYLIIKSGGYIPKIIGVFLVAASVGYLMDSIAHFILPNYTDFETIFVIIVAVSGVIGEISLALWFLIKGVKIENTE